VKRFLKRNFLYLLSLFFLLVGLTLKTCSNQESNNDNSVIKPNAKGIPCAVTKVVDGDTFHCILASGEEITVRLIGIDTPESKPNRKAIRDVEKTGIPMDEMIRMGKEAAEFTKSLIPPITTVELETDVQLIDKYGRVLAYVWLPDGRMLNEVLVREGYARVYTVPPNVKYQELFLKAQREAREKGKGFWKEFPEW